MILRNILGLSGLSPLIFLTQTPSSDMIRYNLLYLYQICVCFISIFLSLVFVLYDISISTMCITVIIACIIISPLNSYLYIHWILEFK